MSHLLPFVTNYPSFINLTREIGNIDGVTRVSSMSNQNLPSLYALDKIEKAISKPSFSADLIQGIQDGFIALEDGKFFAAPIQTMGIPPFPFLQVEGYAAQTCVKSGYFKNDDYYVIKVASGGNPMPNSGVMQIYSQSTGKLISLLMDEGVLTEIRTAAVGALAAKLMAPKEIRCIGILGTGVQARYQLEMLATVTECRKTLVWGRTQRKAHEFCEEITEKGWDAKLANRADDLLMECDLVITVTCAREPILGLDMDAVTARRKPLHITCIGADAPGKTELNPALIAKAELLVADTVEQSAERGEFQCAIQEGLVERKQLVSLGHFIQMVDKHRKEKDNRLTIFDSSGVALQDCVVAQLAYQTLNDSE